MSRYDLNSFVQNTSQRDLGQGLFELENDRLLEINLSFRGEGFVVIQPYEEVYMQHGN